MKKTAIFSLLLAMVLMCSFTAQGIAAQKANLYDSLSKKNSVNVFISEVKDSSETGNVDVDDLKKELTTALENRKSIKFNIVSAKAQADIVIDCAAVEILWTDKDPVDDLRGTGFLIMDAISEEKYARLAADFKVTDAKTDKVLWEDRVKATITEKEMSPEESIPMANDRLVKMFIKECFNKQVKDM